MPEADDDVLLPLEEASRRFNVPEKQLRRRALMGRLRGAVRSTEPGSKDWLIPVATMEALLGRNLEANALPAPPAARGAIEFDGPALPPDPMPSSQGTPALQDTPAPVEAAGAEARDRSATREVEAMGRDLEAERRDLERRRRALEERAEALSRDAKLVSDREKAVAEREAASEARESSLPARLADLERRELEVERRGAEIAARYQRVKSSEAFLLATRRQLDEDSIQLAAERDEMLELRDRLSMARLELAAERGRVRAKDTERPDAP